MVDKSRNVLAAGPVPWRTCSETEKVNGGFGSAAAARRGAMNVEEGEQFERWPQNADELTLNWWRKHNRSGTEEIEIPEGGMGD